MGHASAAERFTAQEAQNCLNRIHSEVGEAINLWVVQWLPDGTNRLIASACTDGAKPVSARPGDALGARGIELFEHNIETRERISIGALVTDAPQLPRVAPVQIERLCELVAKHRVAVLSGTIDRTLQAISELIDPVSVGAYPRFSSLLGEIAKIVANEFAGQFRVYLRRPYLPMVPQWSQREEGYWLQPSAADASPPTSWMAVWDVRFEQVMSTEGEELPDWSIEDDGSTAFALCVSERALREHGDAMSDRTTRHFGVLSTNPIQRYFSVEVDLLRQFARHLARAVRNGEIFHRMAVSERLSEGLGRINQVSELLDEVSSAIDELYCPTELAVLRLNEDRLQVVYQRGVAVERLPVLDVTGEVSAVTAAARTGKVVYMRSTARNRSYLQINERTRAQVAIPLDAGLSTYGVLLVAFPTVDPLGAADQSLLRVIAARLAFALRRVDGRRHADFVVQKTCDILPYMRSQLQLVLEHEDIPEAVRSELRTLSNDAQQWSNSLSRVALARAIEPGAARPASQVFELVATIERLLDTLGDKAEAAGCELRFEDARGPFRIKGRVDFLTKALSAVLHNAFEVLADQPSDLARVVTISLATDTTKPGPGTPPVRFALIDVVDTGPGVDPDIRDRLFEPLFTTKRFSTGLGLFVARGLIEWFGGDLKLLSSANKKGSTFRFRVPLV